MITKEQFDLLKVGDVIIDLDNHEYTIIDRLTNVIFVESKAHRVYLLSLNELNRYNYSIKSTPKHLYGIPFGDYSDKEVYVIVSGVSLGHCNIQVGYLAMLTKVDEYGFHTNKYGILPYAKVISNNVNLICG